MKISASDEGPAVGVALEPLVTALCNTPADCPASFSGPPSYDYPPQNCQGTRREATCVEGVCGSRLVDDDSACGTYIYVRCDPLTWVQCTGEVDQVPLACPPGQ